MITLDQELIAYTRMAISRAESGASCESMAYVSLKAACLLYRKYKCEFADLLIDMAHTAKLSMANMTPRQMLSAFPLDKVYYGESLQCKDYFTSMEMVNTLPLDEPIGEDNIDSFLWEYNSFHVREFVLVELMLLDDMRQQRGERSMLEEWCAENGVQPIRRYETDDGRGYFFDPATGKTMRERVRAPWKYKVIKGGRQNGR